MTYPVIRELANDRIPVGTACRVLGVSPSGYDEWRGRGVSRRDLADAYLTDAIADIHAASHGTYGARRVHAELRLGRGCSVAGKRIARLMRCAHRAGVTRRRLRGCTRRDARASPHPDLVARRFAATEPNRLFVADITGHPTLTGLVYLAVVLDAFSRRVVGWAIGEHIRAELVVDALQMALWCRRPAPGAIHHSDHGTQYTSWAFGHRLRAAGLLASMGSIGDCFDNAMAESFFATLQTELLDRRRWDTRQELASAVFAYIEGFYNPRRRHSALGYLSPADYEARYAAGNPTAA